MNFKDRIGGSVIPTNSVNVITWGGTGVSPSIDGLLSNQDRQKLDVALLYQDEDGVSFYKRSYSDQHSQNRTRLSLAELARNGVADDDMHVLPAIGVTGIAVSVAAQTLQSVEPTIGPECLTACTAIPSVAEASAVVPSIAHASAADAEGVEGCLVGAPPTYPETTIVGWIDGTAITLPTNESYTVYFALNASSTVCAATLGAWAANTLIPTNPNDIAYADAWLIKNSANSDPGSSIVPPVEGILGPLGAFRLFNDFEVGAGGVPVISNAVVGYTPDPCGLSPLPIPATTSGYNGTINTSLSGYKYQLAEGQVGSVGATISQNLNGRPVPWIWSVAEFDQNGQVVNVYSPANYQIFPTYSIYLNGILSYKLKQSPLSTVLQLPGCQLLPGQIQ